MEKQWRNEPLPPFLVLINGTFPFCRRSIMSVAVPHVRVGEPVRCQALSVFPLFDGQIRRSNISYPMKVSALAP